jgi:hypothetical protein
MSSIIRQWNIVRDINEIKKQLLQSNAIANAGIHARKHLKSLYTFVLADS